jgi:VWFA-related protein
MRTSLLLAAIAAAAVSTGSAGARDSAALLNVDVVAVDRRGVPVTDLKPEEFEVWINGFQIPIQTVTFATPSDAEEGRTIVLLLDDTAVGHLAVPRIRETARHFVNRLSSGDRMAIASLNDSRMEITDDRSRLLRAIDSYNVRGVPTRYDVAGEQVLTTIATVSRQIAETGPGRKAIVALGSAGLFDLPIPPPQIGRNLRPEWLNAMRASAAAHVSLYVIDPGGLGPRRMHAGDTGFARETGGHSFVNTNDFNGAVDRILRELGTYYVLTVEDPPIGRKADLRELEIKVRRKGVTVRARRGILPGG